VDLDGGWEAIKVDLDEEWHECCVWKLDLYFCTFTKGPVGWTMWQIGLDNARGFGTGFTPNVWVFM